MRAETASGKQGGVENGNADERVNNLLAQVNRSWWSRPEGACGDPAAQLEQLERYK
jgi:hypothetical protein